MNDQKKKKKMYLHLNVHSSTTENNQEFPA